METEEKSSQLLAIYGYAVLSLLILMQDEFDCVRSIFIAVFFYDLNLKNPMQENQQQHFSQVTFMPKNKSIQSIRIFAFEFVSEKLSIYLSIYPSIK